MLPAKNGASSKPLWNVQRMILESHTTTGATITPLNRKPLTVTASRLLTSLVEAPASRPNVLVAERRIARIVLARYIDIPNEKDAPKHKRRKPLDLPPKRLGGGTPTSRSPENGLCIDKKRHTLSMTTSIAKHPLDRQRDTCGLEGP